MLEKLQHFSTLPWPPILLKNFIASMGTLISPKNEVCIW